MASPSVHNWSPGQAVAQYVLVKEIARGGMGEIWLARQTGAAGFDRLVVLKRMITGGGADAAAMTMFLDEARIASQLSHPNIVQVFDLRQEASAVFLVMEFLTGQPANRFARKMIERSGQVPAALAVSIIAPAARALGYAHRRADLQGKALSIVHRDVSPQNLFLTYEGEVKVLDFGIALAAGRLARTAIGYIKGKVAYMSPEQAGGGGSEVTGAADVYALGVILFELVTGTRFYGKVDDMAVLRRLAAYAPPPTPSSRAQVEPELEAIILRALAPEVADRFADGQAFFEALDAWRKGHPPAAGEPSLQQAMAELFATELAELPQLYREAANISAPAPEVERPLATPIRVELPTAAAKPSAVAKQGAKPIPVAKPSAPSAKSVAKPSAKPIPVAHAPPTAPTASSMVTVPSLPQVGRVKSRSRVIPVFAVLGVALAAGAAVLVSQRAPELASAPPERSRGTPEPIPPSAVEGQPAAPPVAIAPTPTLAGDAGVAPVAVALPPEPIEQLPPPPPPRLTAPTEQTPPPPPKRPPALMTGLLTLGTQPYTRVFAGGRLLGDTPLVEVSLPAGRHQLRLVNEAERVDSVIEVVIKPGQTTVKKVAF